jgi:hypothetical protein
MKEMTDKEQQQLAIMLVNEHGIIQFKRCYYVVYCKDSQARSIQNNYYTNNC